MPKGASESVWSFSGIINGFEYGNIPEALNVSFLGGLSLD